MSFSLPFRLLSAGLCAAALRAPLPRSARQLPVAYLPTLYIILAAQLFLWLVPDATGEGLASHELACRLSAIAFGLAWRGTFYYQSSEPSRWFHAKAFGIAAVVCYMTTPLSEEQPDRADIITTFLNCGTGFGYLDVAHWVERQVAGASVFKALFVASATVLLGSLSYINGREAGEQSDALAWFKAYPALISAWFALTLMKKQSGRFRYSSLVFQAEIFCGLGDVLLQFEANYEQDPGKPPYFLVGLVSFLVGHLLLTAAFTDLKGTSKSTLRSTLLYSYAVAFVAILWPGIDNAVLRGGVICYAITIATMADRALGAWGTSMPANIGAIGALLFVISDSMLAYDKFRQNLGPYRDLYVLTTYFSAIALFAVSCRQEDSLVVRRE